MSTLYAPPSIARAAERIRNSKRMEAIIETIARELTVDKAELGSPLRGFKHVAARELVVYFARIHTPYSYPNIARWMGKTRHSAMVEAHQRISRRIAGAEPMRGQGCPLRTPAFPEGVTATTLVGYISAKIDAAIAHI